MTTRQRASSSTADAGTAEQYEQQQIDEWNIYVARVAIDFHGTRAYNVGDPVPASAVDGDTAWVPGDYVEQRTPFEGSATVVPPEPPTIDPTTLAAPAAATPDAVTTTEG
jgi:hypothetical protein